MFLADFHLHTNYSDGKLSISELVDLYGKNGFGAIAITDHLCEQKSFLGKAAHYLGCSLHKENFGHYLEQIAEEAERAWHQYRMLVIPGVEMTLNSFSNQRSAHILALGLRNYIEPCADIVSLCRRLRQEGAVVIAAHPVPTRKWEKQTLHLWDRRAELAPEFDAWEVASGPHIFEEVLYSGLPLVANSDFHHPGHMRSWKNIFHGERSESAVLDKIRKQELEFYFYETQKELGFLEQFATPFPVAR